MCGRITLTDKGIEEVAAALEAEVDPADAAAFQASNNISPSEGHFVLRVVRGHRKLVPALWGFTVPHEKRLLINARAETAGRLGRFKAAFTQRRCVVPTDGFYEWTGPPGKRRPLWFRPARGGLLLLAGLYEESERSLTFTILTTRANELIAPIHDRMPVVVRQEDVGAWLASPEPELLEPVPPEMLVAVPASPSVNAPRGKSDEPELHEEVERSRALAQHAAGAAPPATTPTTVEPKAQAAKERRKAPARKKPAATTAQLSLFDNSPAPKKEAP